MVPFVEEVRYMRLDAEAGGEVEETIQCRPSLLYHRLARDRPKKGFESHGTSVERVREIETGVKDMFLVL